MPRHRMTDQPVMPTQKTVEHVRNLLRHLDDKRARFVLEDRGAGVSVELNEDLYEIFRQVLVDLSQNRAVSILPIDHELTTFQAADLLNVSRPHVIKLIEQHELPCRMVGCHRRIQLMDLLAYKARKDAKGKEAREALTRIAQDHGLGY